MTISQTRSSIPTTPSGIGAPISSSAGAGGSGWGATGAGSGGGLGIPGGGMSCVDALFGAVC
jgi:hypothetical protein